MPSLETVSTVKLPALLDNDKTKISHLEVGKVYMIMTDTPEDQLQDLLKVLSSAGIFCIFIKTDRMLKVFSTFPVRVDIPPMTVPVAAKAPRKKSVKSAKKSKKLLTEA